MLNEDDVDLEDIESRLYSLVYHSAAETGAEQAPLCPQPVPDQAVALAKPPSRYFHNHLHRGGRFRKNNAANNQFKKPANYPPSALSHSQNKLNKSNHDPGETVSSHQLVVVNPYKNIVRVSDDNAIKKRRKNKANKKNGNKWKENERKLRNLLQILTPPNKPKRTKNKDVKPLPPPATTVRAEVITLSDSDNDDCVEIPKVWPCLTLADSDEDKTLVNEQVNSSLDEVVFIEPVPAEVISIEDEDTICNQSDSGNNYSELVCTPDGSVSNDFIEPNTCNTDSVNRGSLFFPKSLPIGSGKKSSTEICETESSSSTNDVGLVKGSVFNEVEFPKDDIFADANLETFGDFITPMRKTPHKDDSTLQASTPKESKVAKGAYATHSSESSSESDYDEVGSSSARRVERSKALPDLSHMHVVDSTESEKRSKKSKKSKSKPDNPVEVSTKKRKSEQTVPSERTKSKKSRSKKRKTSCDALADNDKGDAAITSSPRADSEDPNEENDEETKEAESREVENLVKDTPALLVAKELTEEVVDEIGEVRVKEEANPDVLEGFEVVDETFGTTLPSMAEHFSVILSDSDSNLSPLDDENVDIRLGNCDDVNKNDQSSRKSKKKKWDLTTVSVKDVQNRMPDDPNLWKILESDRAYYQSPARGRRCKRCRQFGHFVARCPNNVGPVKCSLCGFPGHMEPRCPNKICTQCGTKGSYSTNYCGNCFKFRRFQCRLCGLFGHLKDKCPDLWRRYHLTTEEGPLVNHSGPILKPKQKLWCSGCARAGHLEHSCKYYTPEYPATAPEIFNYKDVYFTDYAFDSKRGGDGGRQQSISSTNQINRDFFVGGSSARQHSDSARQHSDSGYGNFTGNIPDNLKYYVGNPVAFQARGTPFEQPNQSSFNRNPAHTVTSGNLPHFERPDYVQDTSTSGYYFEDNLPSFLSFEVNNQQFESPVLQQPRRPEIGPQLDNSSLSVDNKAPPSNEEDRALRFHNKYHVFFDHPVQNIQQFISSEIRKMMKLSSRIGQISKTVKKSFSHQSFTKFGPYYKTLNMLLFGLYLFENGKLHMDKLRNFRIVSPKTKLTRAKRDALYDSYCYIFGSHKHNNVDYDDLLMRI